MIWRIRQRDGWLYIYLLLEFQRAVDLWMALRILVDTGLFFLLKEASVEEAQRADESNTVGGIIRIEKRGTPADIRRAVARLHQRLQGAQYDSLRRGRWWYGSTGSYFAG